MPEIILHHYPQSPVAEKVRLVLGIKDLDWNSVLIPRLPPKPELMPLTGGYRMTPVMQIGADVFCDSQCIIRELERRYPHPTLFGGGDEGTAWGFSRWTDGPLFRTVLAVIFADGIEATPPDVTADRLALFFPPGTDKAALQAALPENLAQLRAQMAWLEAQLAARREYLMGPLVRLMDVLCYHLVWFVRGRYAEAEAFLGQFPRLVAWEERVKRIGHGRPVEISAAEALETARAGEPEAARPSDDGDPRGLKPGDEVTVTPLGAGPPVAGTIRLIGLQEIVIEREDAAVGRVAVHFPQIGYRVQRT